MSLDHVRRTYEEWGRRDPFHAVLTRKGLEGGRWDPDAFFATGREEVRGLLAYLRSLDLEVATGAALDFGCGVGRITQALAESFDEVVGVDISASMVEKARELAGNAGGVRFVHNDRPDLSELPGGGFDLVYTNITLQHVPPRYAKAYVRDFFRVLRVGGVAVFHLPTGSRLLPGPLGEWLYSLRRERVRRLWQRLRGRPPYEMHFVPRAEVEVLVEESGGKLLDVVDVGAPRRRGRSLRYCAVRRTGGEEG